MIYLTWSMRYGKIAGPNPWPATGLEWKTASPPLTENFPRNSRLWIGSRTISFTVRILGLTGSKRKYRESFARARDD